MKQILLIACILTLYFPGFLSAELYKYYDTNGTLCFTDDFTMVPVDQRPTATTIREIQTKPAVPSDTQTDDDTQSTAGQMTGNEAALKSYLEKESKELGAIKQNLDEEYEALKERRELLILDGRKQMDSKQTQAYNQAANDLNRDTLKYKEEKQAYLTRLEKYNLKLATVQ